MLQLKIDNKADLLKALSTVSIKKIQCNEIRDQKDTASFITDIKPLINSTGTLTLIAIKE